MAGDADAFAVLMRREVPRMMRVAVIMLRDDQWAQDAIQQAMVRAWRDLPRLREPDRFEAWFRRVVVHSCLDEARRQRRHPMSTTTSAAEVPLDDRSTDIAERDRLDRAFRQLPLDQRAVLVLSHHLQMSHPDIAETLGVAVGTVKSRLSRGLAAMRASLAVDEAADRGEVTR
jgi:RNA polymerase sigma-70 factor (ECF subfamily)